MPPTEEMRKWLLEIPGATGLEKLLTTTDTDAKPSDAIADAFGAGKVSAAPARPGGPAPSKDAKEKQEKEEKEKAAKEKTAKQQKIKDLDKELQEVYEAFKDPEKNKTQFDAAKRKWGVPSYYDNGGFAKEDDVSKFWDDLKTGNEKLREYYDYIQKATNIAINSFDITGLERLKETAQRMKELAGKLTESWDKFNKAYKRIEEGYKMYDSMMKFADASIAMDPRKRETVMPWVKSMQQFMKDLGPFLDRLKKIPGQGGAVVRIVTAVIEVGLGGLEAGVKVVNLYLTRQKAIIDEIDRQAGQGRWMDAAPPPPPPPTEWKSRDQLAGEAKLQEMNELTGKIRGQRDYEKRMLKEAEEKALKEAREKYEREHKEAIDEYNNKLFPPIYVQHRKTLRQTILANLRKRKEQDANDKWLRCLTADDAAIKRVQTGGTIDDDPNYSQQAGIYITPTKAAVNQAEAREEVVRFLSVKPPFPDFNKLHDPGLEKHLAKVTVPFTPPE